MLEVVAGLIRDGERFLICQRPAHKARGLMWEFAGGKVENGETGQQALKRELREELGIEVEVQEQVADVTYAYPELTVHLTLYGAAIVQGKPQLLEHNDLRWIMLGEAVDGDFCPADRLFLAELRRRESIWSKASQS